MGINGCWFHYKPGGQVNDALCGNIENYCNKEGCGGNEYFAALVRLCI